MLIDESINVSLLIFNLFFVAFQDMGLVCLYSKKPGKTAKPSSEKSDHTVGKSDDSHAGKSSRILGKSAHGKVSSSAKQALTSASKTACKSADNQKTKCDGKSKVSPIGKKAESKIKLTQDKQKSAGKGETINSAKPTSKKKSKSKSKPGALNRTTSEKKSPSKQVSFIIKMAPKIVKEMSAAFSKKRQESSATVKPKSKDTKSKSKGCVESKKATNYHQDLSHDKELFEIEITTGKSKKRKGTVKKRFPPLSRLSPTGRMPRGSSTNCLGSKSPHRADKNSMLADGKSKTNLKKTSSTKQGKSSTLAVHTCPNKKPSSSKLVSASKAQQAGKSGDKEKKKSKDQKSK